MENQPKLNSSKEVIAFLADDLMWCWIWLIPVTQ